ncbi:hypothetical protein CAEBREN_13508 [Caenorhabditis brenneri]|uniref:Uncharacterized protein n=1 Tax=Caenorhabditis brenneri TaxID=135651 RepID=G0PMF2_CAEBE|nr:hypothetical protein CAEBREN_13508 [Caenorhabditis brenneri]
MPDSDESEMEEGEEEDQEIVSEIENNKQMFLDPDFVCDEGEGENIPIDFENFFCSWQIILPILSKCWSCLKNNMETSAEVVVKLRGVAIEKVCNLFKVLNSPFISKSRYHELVNKAVKPAIEKVYDNQRKLVLSEVKETMNVDGTNLAGDGQFDSRGFSAVVCRFTIMDISTKYVLDFEVSRKDRGGNSVIMEKTGHEKCFPRILDELQELTGLPNPIASFTTDRCVNLTESMKKYPTIHHYYDSWHYVRCIRKDIEEVFGLIGEFTRSYIFRKRKQNSFARLHAGLIP